IRAVKRIVEISDAGRAPKNDPAIFALALVVTNGDAQAKTHAFANLGKVCRIGTHLFHFAEYVNAMRGLGSRSAQRCRGLVRGTRSRRSRSPGGEVSAARRLVARRPASSRSPEDSFATTRRGIPLDAERPKFGLPCGCSRRTRSEAQGSR